VPAEKAIAGLGGIRYAKMDHLLILRHNLYGNIENQAILE
jgi:hypothetical protein